MKLILKANGRNDLVEECRGKKVNLDHLPTLPAVADTNEVDHPVQPDTTQPVAM